MYGPNSIVGAEVNPLRHFVAASAFVAGSFLFPEVAQAHEVNVDPKIVVDHNCNFLGNFVLTTENDYDRAISGTVSANFEDGSASREFDVPAGDANTDLLDVKNGPVVVVFDEELGSSVHQSDCKEDEPAPTTVPPTTSPPTTAPPTTSPPTTAPPTTSPPTTVPPTTAAPTTAAPTTTAPNNAEAPTTTSVTTGSTELAPTTTNQTGVESNRRIATTITERELALTGNESSKPMLIGGALLLGSGVALSIATRKPLSEQS